MPRATKKEKVTEAVEQANTYINEEKIKQCDELIERIKKSRYARIDEAIKGLAAYQIEILELMKKG